MESQSVVISRIVVWWIGNLQERNVHNYLPSSYLSAHKQIIILGLKCCAFGVMAFSIWKESTFAAGKPTCTQMFTSHSTVPLYSLIISAHILYHICQFLVHTEHYPNRSSGRLAFWMSSNVSIRKENELNLFLWAR